jgi:general secretion pathway protein M
MNALVRLRAWLDRLAERERRMVLWGGLAAALVIFFAGLVLPLYAVAAKGEKDVARKQDDLAWMRSVAPELRAAGPAAADASGGSLVVVVDQTARAAGLASALTGTQPSSAGGIRARFDGAAFDTLIGWLAQLQQRQGVIVESATVDRTATPGIVNASIIIRKAG